GSRARSRVAGAFACCRGRWRSPAAYYGCCRGRSTTACSRRLRGSRAASTDRALQRHTHADGDAVTVAVAAAGGCGTGDIPGHAPEIGARAEHVLQVIVVGLDGW